VREEPALPVSSDLVGDSGAIARPESQLRRGARLTFWQFCFLIVILGIIVNMLVVNLVGHGHHH